MICFIDQKRQTRTRCTICRKPVCRRHLATTRSPRVCVACFQKYSRYRRRFWEKQNPGSGKPDIRAGDLITADLSKRVYVVLWIGQANELPDTWREQLSAPGEVPPDFVPYQVVIYQPADGGLINSSLGRHRFGWSYPDIEVVTVVDRPLQNPVGGTCYYCKTPLQMIRGKLECPKCAGLIVPSTGSSKFSVGDVVREAGMKSGMAFVQYVGPVSTLPKTILDILTYQTRFLKFKEPIDFVIVYRASDGGYHWTQHEDDLVNLNHLYPQFVTRP